MADLPKTAKTVTNFVVAGRFFELATNAKATRFWVWEGRYFQTARGATRLVNGAREIDRDRAVRLAELAERHEIVVDARRAAERVADAAAEAAELAAEDGPAEVSDFDAAVAAGQTDLFN